ncbi:MAG: isoprenyl transferase [Alphaproteobacteria bacterium]|jgi:di-trans,poly-cis-decaprenylcistransferase|uniref:isoprenyl transferase n=1 Tax=Candidatus Scatocola faecigallinarum TaxID=2840916 RepID=UPI00033FA9D8|nr:isoprenyl transferase [Alphaproteobacteria bacterium]MBS6995841.1 isoprenyl transferase [Azospirillum sp.]CDB53635.1 isoprenyl transferase [Azospirillum sp. CAG:239]
MVLTKENNKLEHLAIIMDGNGRWAARRGLPRSMGHRKGAEVVKEITRAAGELGIKYLTLYAFSTENWNRSEDEVKTLMGLLRDYLQSDLKEVQQNNVRIRFIGEREMLDADIVRKMAEIEADTLRNTGMTLCIALSYGSRQEIVNAVKKTAALVKEGDISLNDVDVKLFSDMLYTKDMPDPDLVIRTSGEQRISNYLLWQIAYAEFFFTDVLWPDFNKKLLEDIIKNFNMRERRYGKA